MLTTMKHLSEGEKKQLEQIVQKVVSVTSPEKIICYGSQSNTMQDWGCFLTGEGYRKYISTRYDLLVITNTDEKRHEPDIIQLVEDACKPVATVTCIVHKLTTVNKSLEQGSRFFTALYNKGLLLYDYSNTPLTIPHEKPDITVEMNRVKSYWDKEYQLAQHFLTLASNSLSSGWPVITAFLLHQAAEHVLTVLIRVITGYQCKTHNLSRLLALTENFTPTLLTVFPCLSNEEEALFRLLARGYIDSRYKDEYAVTLEQATILHSRVKELQILAEHLYKEKINSYNHKEGIDFPLVVDKIKQ